MGEEERHRVRELGIVPGRLPPGDANSMTDVPGVAVGHETVREGGPENTPCIRSGVSIINPEIERNLYADPVVGAAHVLNGFGKSVGLPQVEELGEIETPIGLTNTLDVWTVADGLVEHVLDENSDATSVNPVVGECNDGVLNDIRGQHLSTAAVQRALDACTTENVQEGCVGAGTGTTGFGWKAGIGTASRTVDGHTLGALVLTNTGKPQDLRIDGLHVDRYIEEDRTPNSTGGSIMMLLGTDAALSARQLSRVTRRATLGLGRVGGIAHHGSGDFAIGFANGRGDNLPDAELTPLFRAAIESTEEAIYNSLTRAEATTGVGATTIDALPLEGIRAAVQDRGH
jgi:D-aminopeptidase